MNGGHREQGFRQRKPTAEITGLQGRQRLSENSGADPNASIVRQSPPVLSLDVGLGQPCLNLSVDLRLVLAAENNLKPYAAKCTIARQSPAPDVLGR